MGVMTAELKLKLEQRVQIRAGRRIRNLRVEVSRERIVLRGQTDTYYAKQMAQHGVRDLLPEAHLENAITVGN